MRLWRLLLAAAACAGAIAAAAPAEPEPHAASADPSRAEAEEFVGPPAPPSAEEVRQVIPQDPNAAERYHAIYALMQFAGMPTLQSEARERDEFIRAMTGYFAEHTRQLIEATKLPKCEFAAAFDRLDALLFHLEEVKALDRLLRWDSNRMYQSKDLQAVGERLAARVRLARHLGGSLSLVEKREAIAILEDDVRLIRAWAREADEADRLAVAAELEKVDPVDPFACRAGLDHLAEVMLVPIAKRDPALKIPWIERMPAGKAVELAQLTANGITEIKKAWTEPPPKGSQTIKAVIDALNLFGSPHPLTGIDQLHARCMTLREGVASAIAELKAPRGQAVGAAPAGK